MPINYTGYNLMPDASGLSQGIGSMINQDEAPISKNDFTNMTEEQKRKFLEMMRLQMAQSNNGIGGGMGNRLVGIGGQNAY